MVTDVQFKQDVNDKRNSIRLDFKVPVELYCAETDSRLTGELINLSVHGMLVEVAEELPSLAVGSRIDCKARIIFPGKGSSLMIDNLETSIARVDVNKLGLQFSEPLEWFLLFNVYQGKQIHQ